jgi:lipoprotein-releasing system permease protein
MSVERFITRRYLFGRKRFTFINIISILAMLGIMFGVAALVVVMSVFNGFNGLVVSILQDFDPHLKIEKLPKQSGIETRKVYDILKDDPAIEGISPFIERKAMATAHGGNWFVMVKGIDRSSAGTVSRVQERLAAGSFAVEDANAIVPGISLADKMRTLPGDTVTLISPAGMENMLTQFVMPTAVQCRVKGIFESRNKLYDGTYAFVSLRVAQKLFRMDDRITGYEVRLRDVDESAAMKKKISEAIGPGWNVLTWEDLHRDLYSVMKIERWSAFILLSVIIAVAAFNILASLTMLVLEKRRDIGILRTMGMTAKRIQGAFLYQGFVIGLIGVGAGLVLGLGVCWLQAEYGLFKLQDAFIIPALPVEVRIADILLISIGTFVLCVLAAWFPARRARQFEVIDAIRWE